MAGYQRFSDYLSGERTSRLSLKFSDIEKIIGQSLPPSARRHQAWWANTDTHSHSRYWLRNGWKTENLDLSSESISFVRKEGGAPVSNAPIPANAPPFARQNLSPLAQKMVEAHAREKGVRFEAAIAEILNAEAVRRRSEMFDWFDRHGTKTLGTSSAELIREDRDAR